MPVVLEVWADARAMVRKLSWDERLRRQGFRIKHRPEGKPARWALFNELYQSEILFDFDAAVEECQKMEQAEIEANKKKKK